MNLNMLRIVASLVLFLFVATGCSNDDGDETDTGDQPLQDVSDDTTSDDAAPDGAGADAASFADYTEERETATDNGEFYVAYTPSPDPIPTNELFELSVDVAASSEMSEMVDGAEVHIQAEMPTHGHGMNTQPEVTEQSGGTYLIEGMQFHMPSDPENPWVMELTVDDGETSDVAKFMVVTDE